MFYCADLLAGEKLTAIKKVGPVLVQPVIAMERAKIQETETLKIKAYVCP